MTTITEKGLPSFPEPNKMGAWSILESLSSNKSEEPPYVHPLEKRWKSVLTEKGLEICTENLGSETGSEIIVSDFPDSLPGRYVSARARARKSREETEAAAQMLPPPLPNISRVHMELVREEGMLVMNMVPYHSCFEAQRENGRLTLSFTSEDCAQECPQECPQDCVGDDDEYATASSSSNTRCNEENTKSMFKKAFCVTTS